MHGKGAKSSAYGQILVGIDGSEGAREACKIERLGPDSSWELGFAGCMGRVQNRAFEAGFYSGSGVGWRTGRLPNRAPEDGF